VRCPGRIWTSRARPGTWAAPTRARAPPATACGCWWRSPAPTVRSDAVDFDLSPEHALIRTTARDFAEGEVAPVAEELDRTKAFPYEIVAGLGELNMMGVPFPQEDGGGGAGTPPHSPVLPEPARRGSSGAVNP